jgi:hypothetical protein
MCKCARTAAADLLALLSIAKKHEGDHLDFAVLGLLHAARHPLQHWPGAEALGQLLFLLSDLHMDRLFCFSIIAQPGMCTPCVGLRQGRQKC